MVADRCVWVLRSFVLSPALATTNESSSLANQPGHTTHHQSTNRRSERWNERWNDERRQPSCRRHRMNNKNDGTPRSPQPITTATRWPPCWLIEPAGRTAQSGPPFNNLPKFIHNVSRMVIHRHIEKVKNTLIASTREVCRRVFHLELHCRNGNS